MPRKLYTAAFKRQAVAMLTEQQLSVAEVARRLRAEVQRLKAECDLLKKPPPISRTRRADVPVHR
jgi:transposase-like protein